MKKKRLRIFPMNHIAGRTAKFAAVLVISFALLFSAIASNAFFPRVVEAATPSKLAVNSVASDGKTLHMWTVVASGGKNLFAGWTPFAYTGEVGKTYTVTAYDWSTGKLYFDHWQDGSKDRRKTVTLSTTSTTLKSYYNSGITIAPSTGTLKINAIASDGKTVNMWLTISSGSTLVTTGFTPFSFTATYGKPYTINMANYQEFNFDHWTDGSTNDPRTFTLYQSASYTAYYEIEESVPEPTVIPPPPPDSETPLISITSPTPAQVLTSTSHTMTGTASDNVGVTKVEVSLDGAAYTLASGTASWSFGLSGLSDGSHTLIAKATDAAGNTQSASVSFSVAIPQPDPEPQPDPNPTTGAYVPLYMYPGGTGWTHWQKVIDVKNAHPSVPIVAAINPASGVGSSKNSAFVTGITKLKAAGITVIGYIYTDYGTRDINAIKSEISKYKEWYNVDGIMFDEQSNSEGKIDYYRQLDDYAKSLGMTFTKGNPGADIAEGYIGTLDNFSIRESTSLGSLSFLGGWHTKYDKSNFSFCVYNQPTLDTNYVRDSAKYVSLMYITNDAGGNPYDTVPPYFETMIATLEQVQ